MVYIPSYIEGKNKKYCRKYHNSLKSLQDIVFYLVYKSDITSTKKS